MLPSNVQIAKLIMFVDIWYMVDYLKDNNKYYQYDTIIMLQNNLKSYFITLYLCDYVYLCICMSASMYM